jgi:hypothetical protein
LDGISDEEMVLDGSDRQEGGSGGVRGLEERYWMRFLKGMVTDRNNGDTTTFALERATNGRQHS